MCKNNVQPMWRREVTMPPCDMVQFIKCHHMAGRRQWYFSDNGQIFTNRYSWAPHASCKFLTCSTACLCLGLKYSAFRDLALSPPSPVLVSLITSPNFLKPIAPVIPFDACHQSLAYPLWESWSLHLAFFPPSVLIVHPPLNNPAVGSCGRRN